MSKRQSKTGVQHLVYQAKTGFQFYYTFPSDIGNGDFQGSCRVSVSRCL